jgi:glycosyltransferase involved in cell wall biosynthesis
VLNRKENHTVIGNSCNVEEKKHHAIRVALLGSLPPLRALSSYCYELTAALLEFARVGFISFASIYPAFLYPGGDLKNDDSFPPLRHQNLQIRRNLTWYNPFTWMAEGLRPQADLLHVQWWSLPLFFVTVVICLLFRARKKPVVITVHNPLPHDKSLLFKVMTGLLLKLGNHFIVHTEENRRQLGAIYAIPTDDVTVIPHGPLNLFNRGRTDRTISRESLGFTERHKIILLFGAVRPYKGVHTALNAFAAIRRQEPEARLIIAGKLWENWAPYNDQIEKLGIADSVYCHLDYIPTDTVSVFFTAADLVILPYDHFDSQSGVGATALSFGCPLIVTDTGGLPDLVSDRAFVVPPRQANRLAEAIGACLDDPKKLHRMAESSQQVAKTMAWPYIARQTVAVYRNVLDPQLSSQE